MTRFVPIALLLAASSLFQVVPASAQTYTVPGNATFTNPTAWNFGAGTFGTWGIPASDAGLVLNMQSYFTLTATNDLNLTLNRLNLNTFGTTTLAASLGGNYAFTGAAGIHLLGTGATSITAPVVLGGGATGLTFDGAGAGNLTISSVISSNTSTGAPLVIATDARNVLTGIVTLGGTNTFAGGVMLNSGTLALNSGRALGDRANVLTVNGGALRLVGDISNNITLSSTLTVATFVNQSFNGVLSGAGGLTVRSTGVGGAPILKGTNTYGGATLVGMNLSATAPLDGRSRLVVAGAVGSISNTSGITVRDGGQLVLNHSAGMSAANTNVSTGNAITVQSGFVETLGTNGQVHQSLGTVNAGGLTTLAALSGSGSLAGTDVTIGNLVRSGSGTVVFQGANLGGAAVATTQSAQQGNVVLTQINGAAPSGALVGGTGGAGTTTLKILPWGLGDVSNTGATYNLGSGFVTYDTNGVRLLNTTTEYNTGNNLNTAAATENVRITAPPTALSAPRTVNSLLFGNAGLTQSGAHNLTITSGALATYFGAGGGTTISSPVLFGSSGTGEAVISVVGDLTTGSNNLTLSGGFTAASLTKSGHGDLTISTTNPVISGGITINGGEIKVDAVSRLGLSGANGITVNGHSQAAERAGLHFTHASGTQTLAATTPITVNAGTASITLNQSAATLAVNSVISGSGGVSYHLLSTGGVITIGGVNTYTGPTFISGAGGSFVDISGDSAFGSSADPNASFLNLSGTTTLRLTGNWTSARAINISGGSTLDTQANNATLSGPISGSAGLVKNGSGTLTIGGAGAVGLDSGYSGTLAVSNGTLAITGSGALNAASITLSNSSILTFSGATDIDTTDGSSTPWRSINALTGTAANSIVLGNTAPTAVDLRVRASATAVETPISGFGKLVKTGTGTLTLTGANTFTGGVEVWGGTLTFGADNQLGNSSNGIALKGGTFQPGFAFTTSRAFTLGATPQPVTSGSTVQTLVNGIDAGADLTLSGVVSGAGGFNKSGIGVLALANTGNNFTGDIQISQGSVTYTDSLQLGAASGRVRLNGGTLTYLGTTAQTVARSLIVTASSTVSAGSGAGGSLNLSGSILGASTLSKGGLNTLTLSGASPYFFGTLSIGNGSTATGNVNLTGTMPRASVTLNASSGATLDMSGLTRELGSLGNTTTNTFATGTTLALGTGGALTTGFSNTAMIWNGNVTGNGTASVTKVGISTLSIQSSGNTFGGGFHILSGTTSLTGSAGALPLQSAFTLGAWGSSLNAGPSLTLVYTVGNADRLANAQIIHSNAGEIFFSTNTTTASNEVVGSLRGAGMSILTMSTGGTLNFGDATNGLTRVDRGTFLFRAGNVVMGTTVATTTVANLTFGNNIAASQLIGGGGGTGTQNISILPYAVGGISDSDTGSNFVTYGANGVRVLDTTTEVVSPSNQASIVGAGSASNFRFNNSALTTTQITGGIDLTVNSLSIAGTAGSTRIESAGTEKLILTSGALLNTVANVFAVNTAGTAGVQLGLHVAELRAGASNNLELNVFTTGGDLLLGAKVSTSGGLTKSGAGNLYLSNATNNYSGPTTINAGRLVIDNKAALGSSTSLVIGGGFLQYRGTDTTLTGFTVKAAGGVAAGLGASAGFDIVSGTTLSLPGAAVSGNGGIIKTGAGVLKLQGSNTNTGATIIAGGALAIDGAAALGTNNRLIFATGSSNQGGQTLRFDTDNITLAQDIITNTADSLIGFGFDTNGNNATLNGPVISTTSLRGLYKLGAGNLTLAAANAYTGPTQIFGGSLTLSGANGSILPSTGTSGFIIGTTTYIAPGAALVLDNAAANNNNRLPDVWDTPFGTGNSASGSLRIDGAELKIIGNSSGTPTQEKINGLTINYGTITLQNGNAGTQLVSGQLTRFNISTAGLIRGDNLGGTPGAGSTNWFVTDLGSGGVQLGGAGGAEGTPFVNILPGFMGATTATGLGSDFLTYAADTGFRTLTAGEYQSTIPANNFDLNRAPNIALTGAATVNETSAITALKLGSGASLGGSGTVTLSQSTVLATGSASISVPVLGTKISGANDALAFLTPDSGTTLTVDSVLNTQQLSKYGEGTLLLNQRVLSGGFVVLSQGTLKLGAGGAVNPVGGALFVQPGATLDLNGADRIISALSTTSTLGSFNMGQRQDGTIALGNNRLTLYSDTTNSYAGDITGTGGLTKAFTSRFTTTFTQPLAYTGSTVLRAGTVRLAGAGTLASSAIELRGGNLEFNNTDDSAAAGGYIANRIGSSVPITWAAGTITFSANANTPANHNFGVTTLNGNAALVIATGGSSAPTTVTIANLTRGSGDRGTFIVNGTNVGLAQSPAGGARVFATLINGAAPAAALSGGGGAVGTTTQSILPWAWAGAASSFLTYGADGLRPLATSEYATSLATSTADDNVRTTAATILSAPATANSLITTNGNVSGAFDLTLTSGVLADASSFASIGVNTHALLTGAGNTRELVIFSNNNLILSYNLTTSGGVTKYGSGSLSINGANNSFTGGLTINNGNVSFNFDNQLGAAGGAVRFGGAASDTVRLTYGNSVPLVFNRPIETTSFGGINNSSSSAIRFQLNQPISGAGAIRLQANNAASVFELNATNTHAGATQITSGRIWIKDDTSLGNGGEVLLSGGTLVTRGAWTSSRLVDVSSFSALVTNGGDTTWSGQFIGGGGLNKLGAASLVLTEPMAFSSSINISGGGLTLRDRGSLASSTLLDAAAATSITLDDTGVHFSDRVSDIRPVILVGASFTILGNGTTTTEEVINTLALQTGPSTLTLVPGAGQAAILRIALGATITGNGGVLFRGTNLGVNTPGTAGSASIVLTHAASQNQVSSINTAVPLTGGLAPAGHPSVGIIKGGFGDTSATGLGTQLVTYDLDKGVRLLDPSTEYTTTLNDGSIVTDNIKVDGTTKTLTVATTVNALWLKDGATLSGAGTLTLTSGTLLVTGVNTVNNVISNGTNAMVIGGPGDVTFSATNGITTSGGLMKMGAGSLTLNAANSYGGSTFLGTGSVNVGHSGAFGATGLRWMDAELRNTSGSPMTLTNASTVDGKLIIGGAQDLTLSGGVAINTGTREFNITNTGLTTLSGAISNATTNVGFGLIKTGPGTLVLSSIASTYDGGTTISAGELRLTNASGSATGTGSILVQNGGTLSGTGRAATGAFEGIQIDGTLSIGSATGTQGALILVTDTTFGTGLTLGATGAMKFGLFTGAGAGDNTSNLTASDLLLLTGDISILPGAQLIIENPNGMTAWADGDMWRLWDVTNIGTRSGGFGLATIIAPALSGGLGWYFDTATGILTVGVPEPSRALLTLLGLSAALFRRRRS